MYTTSGGAASSHRLTGVQLPQFLHTSDPVSGASRRAGLRSRARVVGTCLLVSGDAAPTQRLTYKLVFGAVPTGQYLAVTCGRPSCANPWHLRLKRNGIRFGVSHCIRGHA
jgi:hypothetical protein